MKSIKSKELIIPEGWNSTITPKRLIDFNKSMFFLHLAQGITMIILGTLLNYSRGLYSYYFTYQDPTRTQPPVPDPQIDIVFDNVGAWVGSFLLMSALAHFLLAWPLRNRYLENVNKNYNPLRWFEYAFSSSVMIVLIGIFFTIQGIHTLFLFFMANFSMNMFGWLMEKLNKDGNKGKVDYTPYILGFIIGAAPWVVLTSYLVEYSGLGLEKFVIAIYIVELILFNCFAFVMLAYYMKWGKFKDYAFAEYAYQTLSQVAKTALAWIVFGGIFAPG